MKIEKPIDLFELVDEKFPKDYKSTICKNMRKFRLENYKKIKENNKHVENPYSVDNIAELLKTSKVHYKRLENINDKCKYINLEKLIILSIIYQKSLEEFLKQ